MTPSSLQKQFENGCLLPRQSIVLELHRLAAIFLASERFAELRGAPQEAVHPIAVLQAGEAQEIKRILISCAAAIRSLDDYLNKASDLFVYACGEIIFSDQTKEELSVREACNKILHASRVVPGLVTNSIGSCYFDGQITLFSEDPKHKRHSWEARLDVIAFVRESTHYLEIFEV